MRYPLRAVLGGDRLAILVAQRGSTLRISTPLRSRLGRHAPWLALGLAWPALAFAAAGWLRIDGLGAFGLACLPPVLLLAAGARPLAADLQGRTLLLTRSADGRIAAGRGPPLPREAFSLEVAPPSDRLGRSRHRLSLAALAQAGSAQVRLGLLELEAADRREADDIARAIEGFLDGREGAGG